MKYKKTASIMALLLAAAMLIAMTPAVYADEFDFGDTLAVFSEELPEKESFFFDFEPSADTVPDTVFDFSLPEEEERAADEYSSYFDTVTLETDPAADSADTALPYGFRAMPAGFVLSAEDLSIKQKMIAHNSLATLVGLISGVDYEEGRIIFSANSEEYARQVAEAYNAELLSWNEAITVARLRSATVAQAVEVSLDPSFGMPAVEPDYISRVIPDEPVSTEDTAALSSVSVPSGTALDSWKNYYGNSFDPYLSEPGQENYQYQHAVVNSYEAWGVTMGEGVKVGILDTGICANEDLVIRGGYSVVGGSYSEDTNGHGTHVAGIVGATLGNGIGGAGIAPMAELYSYRLTTGNTVSTTNIILALSRARSDGMNIINMSIGTTSYSAQYESAVRSAISSGITIVAAAGNENSTVKSYPAAFNGVIAVGSTNSAGYKSSFSSFGKWITLSAPGTLICSTRNTASGYVTMSGTSMAAPVVTGVAALYKSAYPATTPAQVAAALKKAVNRCSSSDMGAGIIDASKLFGKVQDAPVFRISDGSGNDVTSSAARGVSVSGRVFLSCSSDGQYFDEDTGTFSDFLIYTTDGSSPSVKNGAVVNGKKYEQSGIPLSDFAPGSTVTIRAMAVSGMGVMSRISLLKIKIANDDASSVTICDVGTVCSGKYTTLSASVLPLTASQKVTWSIVATTAKGVSLNASTGKLTTSAASAGTVTVKATAPNGISATKDILISRGNETARSLKLSKRSAVLHTIWPGTSKDSSLPLSVTAYDSKKSDITSRIVFSWVSSNPAVASVDSDGLVTPHAAGRAVITCRAQDGSNLSLTCSVTVYDSCDLSALAVEGKTSVLPGKSATYKLLTSPSNVKGYKKVWELEDNACGATISASGVLKIPAKASGSVTVVGKLTDDGRECDVRKMTVRIQDGIKGLCIKSLTDDTHTDPYDTKYKNITVNGSRLSSLSSATILTVDTASSPYKENEILLGALAVTDSPGCTVTWNVSNTLIADFVRDSYGNIVFTVSDDGVSYGTLKAKKTGTVTLTCKADDSGAKTQSVTVKVCAAPSSVSVSSASTSAVKLGVSTYATPIIPGKSVANKAVFGDEYGKSVSPKVTWTYRVKAASGSIFTGINSNPYDLADVTSAYDSCIKLSSSGQLSVNKSMPASDSGKIYFIDVLACTDQYGSPVSGMRTYVVVPACTSLKSDNSSYTIPTNSSVKLTKYIHSDVSCWAFVSFSSSNPDIAGISRTISSSGSVSISLISGNKTGTATITLKANDGSGKSCSFKVTVK